VEYSKWKAAEFLFIKNFLYSNCFFVAANDQALSLKKISSSYR